MKTLEALQNHADMCSLSSVPPKPTGPADEAAMAVHTTGTPEVQGHGAWLERHRNPSEHHVTIKNEYIHTTPTTQSVSLGDHPCADVRPRTHCTSQEACDQELRHCTNRRQTSTRLATSTSGSTAGGCVLGGALQPPAEANPGETAGHSATGH